MVLILHRCYACYNENFARSDAVIDAIGCDFNNRPRSIVTLQKMYIEHTHTSQCVIVLKRNETHEDLNWAPKMLCALWCTIKSTSKHQYKVRTNFSFFLFLSTSEILVFFCSWVFPVKFLMFSIFQPNRNNNNNKELVGISFNQHRVKKN